MEKYGVIPPKFTKEWWSYFWEYYKIHTIVTVVAVLLIGSTIVQCVRAPKYDLNVLYVNPTAVDENTNNSFTEAISPFIDDITSDDKTLTFIQSLPLSSMEVKDEQTYALLTKLTLELQTGDNWLFIASKDVAEGLISNEAYCDCFMTLDKLGINESDDLVLKSDNSKAYGICLSDNEFLKSTGIDTENTYLLVRCLYDREKSDEKNVLKYENVLKAVNRIIEN